MKLKTHFSPCSRVNLYNDWFSPIQLLPFYLLPQLPAASLLPSAVWDLWRISGCRCWVGNNSWWGYNMVNHNWKYGIISWYHIHIKKNIHIYIYISYPYPYPYPYYPYLNTILSTIYTGISISYYWIIQWYIIDNRRQWKKLRISPRMSGRTAWLQEFSNVWLSNNVAIINHPFGNGLCHQFMVIWGMVY